MFSIHSSFDRCTWRTDVNSMVGLISGWLGDALASGAAAEKPAQDEDTMGGLSEILADILSSLQATFAGQPLDVEISYEPGSKVGALVLSLRAQAFLAEQTSLQQVRV